MARQRMDRPSSTYSGAEAERKMTRLLMNSLVTGKGWLSLQPRHFQSALLSRAVPVEFKAGEAVFHVEDDVGGIFGVVKGSFLIYLPSYGGSLVLAHIVRRGTWFGHGCVFTRDNRTLSVAAAEPSLTLHVPFAALQELVAADAGAARCIGALGEFGARIARRAVTDLLLRGFSQRVAATLLRVTETWGEDTESAEGYFLTQSQLAEMANVSRGVANRALADFEARGWIARRYSRISILDRKALAAEMARSDDARAASSSPLPHWRARHPQAASQPDRLADPCAVPV